MSDAKINNN